MSKHIVAKVSEIPVGEHKIVDVAGRSIGIFNVHGEFYAVRNSCPHQGGPLCEGKVSGFLTAKVPGEFEYSRRGEILRCPWHGWEFDVKTGQSWFDPAKTRVRVYPVTVESIPPYENAPFDESQSELTSAEGMETGPYVAETYPVSVDNEYLVVDVPGR